MEPTKYIYENLDERSIVISLFLDFRKAFDCIDHEILLNKNFMCGVRGMVLKWFRSYLSSREQYVSVSHSSSSIKPMTHGVPQGSTLGPLFFLAFIIDFPQSNTFYNFLFFADEITITCRSLNSNLSIIKKELSNQLIPLSGWLQDNKIKINCEKKKPNLLFSHTKKIII